MEILLIVEGITAMYSARRKKFFFNALFLIFLPLVVNLFIHETDATWVIGGTATNTYPARPGYVPNLEGVQEDAWDSTSAMRESDLNPNLEFHMKFNGSMAFCLIIVKKFTHTINESVLLILSNNGTSLTESKYLIDAKYIDINNNTEDRRLVAGDYVADDDQNITGKMSFKNPSLQNWTVYEFGFRYDNTNPSLDTVWRIGYTYLAKIKVGDAVDEDYIDSPFFAIELGIAVNNTEFDIFDFLLDINTITWIAFSSVTSFFGILGIYVFFSKKKLIGLPGFTGGMLEKKTRYTEQEISAKTKQFGEEKLWDESKEEEEDLEENHEEDLKDFDDEDLEEGG